jgi:hypothetical protein
VVEVFEELLFRGDIVLGMDPLQEAAQEVVELPVENRGGVVVVTDASLPDPVYHLGSSGLP